MRTGRGFSNPFYVLLIAAGVMFCLTACAYGVMTVQALQGVDFGTRDSAGAWLNRQMDAHGVTIMAIEIAVLGFSTIAAISTDRFFTVRGYSDADKDGGS